MMQMMITRWCLTHKDETYQPIDQISATIELELGLERSREISDKAGNTEEKEEEKENRQTNMSYEWLD